MFMNKTTVTSSDLKDLNIANLVAITSLRLELIADRLIFQPLELSAASFRILALLERKKEITPSAILGFLGGSKSNITQRLNYLDRRLLVKTVRATTNDRRRLMVTLTPLGRSRLRAAWRSIDRNSLHVEKYFKSPELKGFYKFMIKLNKGLDICVDHSNLNDDYKSKV